MRPFALVVFGVIASGVAAFACGGRNNTAEPAKPVSAAPPTTTTKPSGSMLKSQPKRGAGPMHDPRASTMLTALKEAGLDPKNLPPLETLDKKQQLAVMKTFSASLGIACVDCHTNHEKFNADTRRKRAAKRMYNELTRLVSFENGDPVYCDSCHQGALFVLDRADKSKVSDYMSDHLVGKMKRTDGRDHDCGTCHGDPPDFNFVTAWKAKPAPDIELRPAIKIAAAAPLPSATTTAATPTPKPTSTQVAATPPPAPAPASTPTTTPPSPPPTTTTTKTAKGPPSMGCGPKNDQCPLQAWMRQYIATAVSASDTNGLAKALDRVATMSPDPAWTSWVDISKKGADAARAGNMEEARKSCQGCHDAYKTKFRASFRNRGIK